MNTGKKIWGTLMENRPDSASNRLGISRRAMLDRRRRCLMDIIFDQRYGGDRRQKQERRKRWKRVGSWGAEIDPGSYRKDYPES